MKSRNNENAKKHVLAFQTYDTMLNETDSYDDHLIRNIKYFRQINIVDCVNYLEASPSICVSNVLFECLETSSKLKPSIKEPLTLDLKPFILCTFR